MSSVSQYFKGLFQGIGSLLTGMRVTWKELFTKKVTSQYPENRDTLVISDRFRCVLVMPHDENNEHNCTSCGICQMNCPNGTINIKSEVIQTEDGKKKKILGEYHYNQGMCTFCNLCVLTCPSDAIKFSNDFENAVFTRKAMDMKLNKEGSKLKEKKKPEPKPVAEKPVEAKPTVAETEPKAPIAETESKAPIVEVEKPTPGAESTPVEKKVKENDAEQSTPSTPSDNTTKE